MNANVGARLFLSRLFIKEKKTWVEPTGLAIVVGECSEALIEYSRRLLDAMERCS